MVGPLWGPHPPTFHPVIVPNGGHYATDRASLDFPRHLQPALQAEGTSLAPLTEVGP